LSEAKIKLIFIEKKKIKLMNLEKIDLRTHLIRMGMPVLEEIIGRDELEAISLITNKSINEVMIADLLIKSGSSEIFSDALIRGYVIHFLPNEYKSYIEFSNSDEKISQEKERQLINRAWNRKFNSHNRLIEIFDLSSDYLPGEVVEENNSEILAVSEKYEEKSFFKRIIEKIISFFNFFLKSKEKETFGLEKFQERIKDKFLKQILNNVFKTIIHMPTGSGKTKTILASLIEQNLKTNFLHNNFIIWLAHSDELCDQAKDSFKNLWKDYGNMKLPIIRLKDQSLDEIKNFNNGLIVCTYAKLHRLRMDNKGSAILEYIRTKSNFIVADEAHMVPAQTFKDSIQFITSLDFTILVGLSATPGGYYTDQTEKLSDYFNKNKISITDDNDNLLDGDDPILYLQNKKVLSKLKTHQVKTDFSIEFTAQEKEKILETFDEGLSQDLIKKMGKNVERNICIYGELRDLYEKNLSTIVFACSLDHAKLLHRICLMNEMKVGKLDDKTSSQQRKEIVSNYKNGKIKIIFNYGILSTGFDAPGTDAILISRPTSSPIIYSQMLGRGLRGEKFGGKSECLLIDLKDNLIGLPDEKDCFTLFNRYYD